MSKPLYCLLVAVVTVSSLHGQSWTVLLGHNQCNALAFANDTFLVGTNSGLFRYCPATGAIMHDRLDFDSIPSHNISSIYIDTDSSRWICTSGYGLIHQTAAGCRRYLYNYALDYGCSIRALAQDSAGHYWAATNDGLYYSADGFQWSVQNGGLLSTNINDLCFDKKGNLCLATENGLAVKAGTSWLFTNQDNSPLPSNYIKSVMVDSADRKWIIVGRGVAFYDSSRWNIYTTGITNFRINNPECLVEGPSGTVWVGSYIDGVGRFKDGRWSFYDTANSKLTHNTALSICRDNAGTMWAGTYDGFLVQLDGPLGVHHVGSSIPITDGVPSAIRASNGDLWCSNAGLMRFNGAQWDTYTHDNSGLPGNGGKNFCEDTAGNLWMIIGKTIVCYNGTAFHTFDTLNTNLPNDWFNCMVYDRKKHIFWIGSEGSGLIRFDGTSCTIYDSSASPACSRINALALDTGDGLWIASLYGGFSNLNNNTLTNFTNSEFGLIDKQINCLMVDKTNKLWVGTREGLLTLTDRAHWHVYDTSNSNIPGNYVLSLTQGSDGAIWAGTLHKGLTRFKDDLWTTFNYGNSPLPGNTIQFLTTDLYGNILIGLFGAGMAVYDCNTVSAHRPEVPQNANSVWATVLRSRAQCTITLRKSPGAIVLPARIINLSGRIVKTIYPTQKESIYHWNYRDECDQRVAPGFYMAAVPGYGAIRIVIDK